MYYLRPFKMLLKSLRFATPPGRRSAVSISGTSDISNLCGRPNTCFQKPYKLLRSVKRLFNNKKLHFKNRHKVLDGFNIAVMSDNAVENTPGNTNFFMSNSTE